MSAEAPKAAVEDLIAKVVGGKALEAFDRYYADDVTMQENEQPPRVGKAACRAFEEDFLSKIKAVRAYVCDGYVISGNKAFIVYRIDADHADWGYAQHERGSHSGVVEWKGGAREVCLLSHYAIVLLYEERPATLAFGQNPGAGHVPSPSLGTWPDATISPLIATSQTDVFRLQRSG
jgi:hypothetical protein